MDLAKLDASAMDTTGIDADESEEEDEDSGSDDR